MRKDALASLLLVLAALWCAAPARAQQVDPSPSAAVRMLLDGEAGPKANGGASAAFPTQIPDLTKKENFSSAMQIVVLLTILSLAPAILLMMTSFTRIVIVLSLLRQALGTQQLPPNQV